METFKPYPNMNFIAAIPHHLQLTITIKHHNSNTTHHCWVCQTEEDAIKLCMELPISESDNEPTIYSKPTIQETAVWQTTKDNPDHQNPYPCTKP